MDFHERISKFCKSCNEIGQKHFGRILKHSLLIQSLEWELQDIYLKLVLKIRWHNFLKKPRKPLFWPFMQKYKILPKYELHWVFPD